MDLAGPPGVAVRAACTGTVAWAAGSVVTLRCGAWRVSVLPVTPRVAAGARVRAGARVGTLRPSPDHRDLHLGVRREGDAFAYVDPAPLLSRRVPPPTRVPRTPRHPAVPRLPEGPDTRAAASGHAPLVAGPAARAPHVVGDLSGEVRVSGGNVAPWPAWLGLVVLALGAVGGRGLAARRRRAAATVAIEPA